MDAILEIFSFEGRANRAWYFWHQFLDGFIIAAMIAVLVVVGLVTANPFVILPAIGIAVGGTLAGIAVTVKRLHDLNRPGWHFLLLAVPLYNIWLSLVLIFKRGSIGFNDYGSDPLAADRYHYLEG